MFIEYKKTLCNSCLGCNKLELKNFKGLLQCNDYRNCITEKQGDKKGEIKWNYNQLKLKN